MDNLLRCDRCGHGATRHDGSGCELSGCACYANRDQVIVSGVEAAKEEIRRLWERPADSATS